MSEIDTAHLGRLVQGLRDELADLRLRLGNALGKETSYAPPCFVTSQDFDNGNALESAWMLGQGETGQPNANACFLQNYFLRVARNPAEEALFAGTVQGQLDLRMNGDDALLSCNVIDPSIEANFTTLLDFQNVLFRIQRGTDPTFYQSFQVTLQNPDQYLLSLSRAEFQSFTATLADAAVTVAWSQSETTGFIMTDAPAGTTIDVKNAASLTAINLIADTTIAISTADVAGNACQFHPWTKNGTALTPPLYVLSSQPGDLGGLPCVFDWVPASGSLGIGTDSTCSALTAFQIEMGSGFNLLAGGAASNLKLDGGSGYFLVNLAADEDVSAHWNASGANIAVGLGSGTNGIYMDFGGGLTVGLIAGDAAALGSGVHQIQFREVEICDSGTIKKMIVLGSETYS